MARSTSMPSMRGILMSRTTTAGLPGLRVPYFPSQRRYASASTPSLTTVTRLARLLSASASSVNSASLGLSSASRICFSSAMVSLLFAWQREIERSALVDYSLGPDAAAMTGDNALNIGQANPGSLEFLLGMQALKYAKELVGVLHVKAYSVIRNNESDFAVAFPGADLDSGHISLPGEFDSVPQQVGPNLTEQGEVTSDRGQFADDPYDAALRATFLYRNQRFLKRLVHVDAFPPQFRMSGARELQQVVDKNAHLARRGGNGVYVVQALVIQTVAATRDKQIDIPVDMPQGRPQIV